ncbi:MAG: right-handed parallel beta-helix repeat-containing protein [Anaeromyxobacter sp.]
MRRSVVLAVAAACAACGGADEQESIEGQGAGPVLASVGTARHVDAAAGNDANAGTSAAPWKTISKAARTAQPGDVVNIRSGTYRERVTVTVSGTAGAPITFQPAAGATVAIVGDPAFAGNPLLYVNGQHDLRFVGLQVRDYATTRVTYGVRIQDSSSVELDGLKVSGISSGAAGMAALPVIVFGTKAASPTRNIVVRRSEIASSNTNPGQALTVLGNVDGFRLEGNFIHDVNGIGIDVAGNTGATVPASPPAGYVYDPATDRARNGSVNGNTVLRCGTIGIYLQGAWNDLVERNTVRSCGAAGIEIAAEIRARTPGPSAATTSASGNTVRDNVVFDITNAANAAADAPAFALGAWSSTYGPVRSSTVTNNLFRSSRGTVIVNPQVSGLVFENNLVVTTATGTTGSIGIVSDHTGVTSANRFDHNLYWWASPPHWDVGSGYYTSLAALRSGTGREAHGRTGDPLFVNGAGGDFHVQPGSPAVGAGDAAVVSPGELDRAGGPRVVGVVDIGPYER